QRLCCIASLFLILFAVSLTTHPAILWLLGTFTATGSVCLMLVYWSRLRSNVGTATVAVIGAQRIRQRLPLLVLLMVLTILGCALATLMLGPQRLAHTLGEWLPTSGGTGGFDPFARSGVNDGNDQISGDNARSAGMLPSSSFIDSPA